MDQMSPVRPGDADDEDEPLLLGHGIQAEELLSVDEIDLKVEKDDFEENSSPSSTSDWIGLTKSRIPYYIPILHWLPRYQWRENFVNDILAGFSVGMVLVPQCLAYSLVMGVSPAVGLYFFFFSCCQKKVAFFSCWDVVSTLFNLLILKKFSLSRRILFWVDATCCLLFYGDK